MCWFLGLFLRIELSFRWAGCKCFTHKTDTGLGKKIPENLKRARRQGNRKMCVPHLIWAFFAYILMPITESACVSGLDRIWNINSISSSAQHGANDIRVFFRCEASLQSMTCAWSNWAKCRRYLPCSKSQWVIQMILCVGFEKSIFESISS